MTPEEANEKLDAHRQRIDELDREIRALLNERTKVVENIGKVKRECSLPIYEPKREEEVFRNIMDDNPGPLPADALKRVFERIIDEMRTVQRDRMKREQE
ncbi:MAG: chorismate mutase [Candidatus Solibacter usitatus]|nr:chorismate mutase [Candidatus Solibacter usitatus]